MAFGQTPPGIFQSRVDWIDAAEFLQASRGSSIGLFTSLTPSPIPANSTLGGMPFVLYHVKVSPAGGAGTYTFLHGLQWTPTYVNAVPEIAQGTTPTVITGWDVADTSTTLVAINVSANCTVDVYYG